MQAALKKPEPSEYILNLDVVDRTTRAPLAGAEIEIVQAEDGLAESRPVVCRGTTDDHGHGVLRLPTALPMFAVAAARKDGYLTGMYELASGRTSETHTLLMERPGGKVGGIVRDDEGRPIAGANVRVLGSMNIGDSGDYARFDVTVETDSGGRWATAEVPKTLTWIHVSAAHSDHVGTLVAGNGRQPAADALRDGTAVIVLGKGGAISGRVLDEQGRPLAGAQVALGADRRIVQRFHPCTTTDAEGRFRFGPIVPAGVQVVTVQAAGHAPDLKQVAVVAEGSSAVEFRLGSPRTFRGRVVDPDGKPLAGATIRPFNWRGNSSIDWQTETGADGRFTWRDAPPDAVSYNVFMPGYMPVRQRWYRAQDIEQVITLDRPLRIHGAVSDFETGKPIAEFTVVPATVRLWNSSPGHVGGRERRDQALRRQMANPAWDRPGAKSARDGRYAFEFSEPRDVYLLRIEAVGYEPLASRPFETHEGAAVFDFRLKRTATRTGIVQTSDGTPVGGATLVVATPGRPLSIRNGRLDPRDHGAYVTAQTTADGRFALPSQDGAFTLIALHELGFAQIAVGRSADPVAVTLKLWSGIEGTLHIRTRRGAHETIRLVREPSAARSTTVSFDDQLETDAQGHYRFDRVFPGEVRVAHIRYRDIAARGGSQVGYAGRAVDVDVRAGETVRVDLGASGRPVIGRVAEPAGLGTAVDWSLGIPDAVTSLTLEQEIPYPRSDMTRDERSVWRNEWLATDAGRAFRRAERTYGVEILPDGSFRVDDVPPGRYTLAVFANRADASRGGILETLGLARRSVIVPTAPGGPIDVGTVEVKLYQKPRVGDRAPDFDLTTIDGSRLRLADLRGKSVLVAFWATWCAPCRIEMERLKAVRTALGHDGSLVVVVLSLDEDARDVSAYSAEHGLDWPQARLDGAARDAIVTAYGVRAVPALFLVGPDGSIVARDFGGKTIKEVVTRAVESVPGRAPAGLDR